MIEHILKPNHNGRQTIIMKCPHCDAWGRLKMSNRKLYVFHGGFSHRVTDNAFERSRAVYNAIRKRQI